MEAKFICLEDKAFYELIDQIHEHLSEKLGRQEDRWIDGEDAMQKLHCGKTKLQQLRNEGQIEFSKMDNIILYNSESINSYIEKHKRETF